MYWRVHSFTTTSRPFWSILARVRSWRGLKQTTLQIPGSGFATKRPLPSLRELSRTYGVSHETVRYWWNRFGPMFASEIRRTRVQHMRQFTHWRWHLDEVYVKINGEMRYLWRAVDHEGEVLESFVTKTRDKAAALKFIKKALKRALSAQMHRPVTGGV